LKSHFVEDRWFYSSEDISSKFLVVNKNTRLLQSKNKLESLEPRPVINFSGKVTLVEGVPGCGKTTSVIKRAHNSDLILTVGRETKIEIQKSVEKAGKKTKVFTVDSYILNCKKKFKTVWLDEGLMIHPGEIDILKDLTACHKMYVYGDRQQIPFIARVPGFDLIESLYSSFETIEVQNLSYRCPKDVAAVLSNFYDKGFKSASSVKNSINLKLIVNMAQIPKGEFQYLTWTQEEKKEMKRRGFLNTITVHESQGKTYKKVCMVRTNTFPVEIFKSKQHALVALSRHREEFFYCTKASLVNDALADMSEKKKVRDALIMSQDGFNGVPEMTTYEQVQSQNFD
jgi:hypothetical protein